LGIPLIDVVENFTAHQEPLSLFPFETEPHYNRRGYAVVAQGIEDHLRRMNLLHDPTFRNHREATR
jgi:hypothetical protein